MGASIPRRTAEQTPQDYETCGEHVAGQGSRQFSIWDALRGQNACRMSGFRAACLMALLPIPITRLSGDCGASHQQPDLEIGEHHWSDTHFSDALNVDHC